MTFEEKIKWYSTNRLKYESLAKNIENLIHTVLDLKKVPYHSVSSRCKSEESYKHKIEKKDSINPIDIHDLAGIRIIGYVSSDVKKISNIIRENFNIDETHSIDKATTLGIDKVGYKSVHFVARLPRKRLDLTEYKQFEDMFFEIQIRTILQHAWAEIEHDKSYKSGILPPQIDRNLKLLAGLLEVADAEFDRIALSVDKYSKEVSDKTRSGNLDIPIDSPSLLQYFKSLFEDDDLSLNFGPPKTDYSKHVIEELNNYGLKTLEDLNKIVSSKLKKELLSDKERYKNLLGATRFILIVNDPEKYFTKSWKKDWKRLSKLDPLNGMGIDIEKVAKKYGITIE